MSKFIGIDLGIGRSVAAICQNGAVQVLQNHESQDVTRSVVGERAGQVQVGQLALDQQLLAPRDTIVSIKRLIGRGFCDEHVQRLKRRISYGIAEPSDGTDNDFRVLMGGKEYSPIKIASMILEYAELSRKTNGLAQSMALYELLAGGLVTEKKSETENR